MIKHTHVFNAPKWDGGAHDMIPGGLWIAILGGHFMYCKWGEKRDNMNSASLLHWDKSFLYT